MKIPDVALKEMEKAVAAMMPYELNYIPETRETELIDEVYTLMSSEDEGLKKWGGFVGYICKKIDNAPELQDKTFTIAEVVRDLTGAYLEDKKKKSNDADRVAKHREENNEE